MAHKTKIRNRLKKYKKQQDLQIGLLGNYSYEVEVPDRPNYVYVRLTGQVVSEVFNDRVTPILDLQVYVGYDDEEPGLFQVLGVRSDLKRYGTDDDVVSYLPSHHATHEWMNYPAGGSDVVFSELRQFMPLRPNPMPTGVALAIYRGVVVSNNKDLLYVSGSTLNLGSYIPPTGSRYAYVGIDSSNGLLTVTGGFVKDSLTLSFTDIPDFIPGTYPIAVVRLYEGQTKIQETYSSTDLVDLRFPFGQSFLNLFDAPGSFTGSANKGVFVNSNETKLEFRVLTGTAGTSTFTGTSFLELGDTPDSYAGSAEKVVAVNNAATGLEFRTLTGTSSTSFTGTSFLELGDTPDSYTGSANRGVFVNVAQTGLEFRILTGTAGTSFTGTSFLELGDTPDSYTGSANKLVTINATANALEFRPQTGTAQAVYFLSGDLTVHSGVLALENRLGKTLTLVGVYVRLGTSPTGTNAIFDINKNGSTTIFTNQSNRPVIITGTTTGQTTTIDVPSFLDSDYYLIDVDQGDGANLSMTLKFIY